MREQRRLRFPAEPWHRRAWHRDGLDRDRAAHDTRIPQFMHPVIALVTAGVEMDVLGIAFSEFTEAEREAVVHAHPRSGRFKEEIIQAFYDAIHPRPETTFGNVKADVLADKDHSFRPENFCRVIRASAWPG
jgi:hypothetical protein